MTSELAPWQAEERPPVLLLVGATATGKTAHSLELAERLNAEIVSVDSRLFYRGLDIGTAKPTLLERARVPHHLIDIAYPDQGISLAEFQRLAHEAITDIVSRARLPLLVGGTGQYVRAVTAGWRPPLVHPNENLRIVLQRLTTERGQDWLHQRLRDLDPEAASGIDARNARRTIRALEVILTTGRKFSQQRARGESPYAGIMVGIRRPRLELYRRIDDRIEEMWRRGLLDETRRLLDQGYKLDLPAMSAIGYSQCIRVIHGQMTPEQAIVEMRRATRAYVRRQSNWFKESDPDIAWFDADRPDVVDLIEGHVRAALGQRLSDNR